MDMQKILENEELMIGLVESETADEMVELLERHNIKLEDGLSAEKAFKIVKEQEHAELNEDALEDVNGGIAFGLAALTVGCFVAGGTALAFLGGYAYGKYKSYKKKKK